MSAIADMEESRQAYQSFKQSPSLLQHYFFESMVIAYYRPFTQNHGVGCILANFPNYPDYSDPEMNARHLRMQDLRNKFVAHSSIEGTRVFIVPPGVLHPVKQSTSSNFDYAVMRRYFPRPDLADWLFEVCGAFRLRLEAELTALLDRYGPRIASYSQVTELLAPESPFEWSKNEEAEPCH
ncbi:MAG: hypothetical protein SFU85_00010 [Candidatus Methylacidiphilales bacterium]|nr:hypothetical protein [Candidatus Methylacidiphilales bacterium]